MVRLQRQKDKVTEMLTGLQDHVELQRLGVELAAVQSALSEAEDAWLALAEEADS